jgi:hypothetical protein
MKTLLTSLFIASTVLTAAAPAFASAFTGGTVINVPRGDKLYVRKWPASTSRIIDAYRRGDMISLTGRCKNIVTNVSFRIDGNGSSGRRYAKMEAPNVWCQVMTEDAELGWARGKYIWPQ